MSIAVEKYVAFTTFRRTGEPVTTPVWIVDLGQGRAGFTTGLTSGKVKRLRHTPAVTLQPCDMRGTITPGSSVVEATARVVTAEDPLFDEIKRGVQRKYGLFAKAIGVVSFVAARVRGQAKAAGNAAVVVDLPA